MAADCGCGGTCPMCSYHSEILFSEHTQKILSEDSKEEERNPPKREEEDEG